MSESDMLCKWCSGVVPRGCVIVIAPSPRGICKVMYFCDFTCLLNWAMENLRD
uniref:MYM-type domain-containing protein n=1 Tax=viral metagenome TaxID=1070528 RepID=A0A6M3LIH6_9ZZZZ